MSGKSSHAVDELPESAEIELKTHKVIKPISPAMPVLKSV
jgi:hypothetical protein